MEYVYIGLALLLVLANGFFVATEFAIVKIRTTRLRQLLEEGRPGAHNASKMVEKLDAYLSATQFGITIASLGLGWLGEPAFARLLEGVLRPFVPESAVGLSHTLAVSAAFILITFLHIVVGELAPKTLAIQKAEATTLAVAAPMRAFYFVFFPFIWALNAVARKFLQLLGLRSASEAGEAHSEEELRFILATSAASGAITASRVELLERALELGQKTARQILVPRNQMKYLDLEEPLEKNIADARSGGHTWLPVCRGTLDQVEGVVNVKDLFFLLANEQLKSLGQVQRPVLFVPEAVTLEQLLAEFRRRRRQIAVVVDEHGGTSGMVTLADVVAEVVGDVAELGRKVDEVKSLPGGKLEVAGSTPLEDLEDRLEVKFDVEPDEVTTIGGYLMSKLGKVVEKGDRLTLGEYLVVVEETDGPRVVRVRIEPKVAMPGSPPAGGSAPPTA